MVPAQQMAAVGTWATLGLQVSIPWLPHFRCPRTPPSRSELCSDYPLCVSTGQWEASSLNVSAVSEAINQ